MASKSSGRTSELKQLIETREARIGIVGMGYVGLPLALLFSEERFSVTGFDIDARKVEKLNQGGSYIVRIPANLIQEARENGFKATADYGEIAQMDVVILCVPTPLDEYHEPDLSYVSRHGAEASRLTSMTGNSLFWRARLIPGRRKKLLSRFWRKGIELISAWRWTMPATDSMWRSLLNERIRGTIRSQRRDIPKVVGGCGTAAVGLASAVYASIFNHIVPVSSPAAAEMTKLLENIYRCVNIALVNELKQLCMRMGIDIFEVIEAAKTKPFGFQAFYPGPGLGGHCIPIDPVLSLMESQAV